MLKKFGLVFLSKVITSFGTVLFVLVLNFYYGTSATGTHMTFISLCLGLSLITKFGSEVYLIKECSIANHNGKYDVFWDFVAKTITFVVLNTICMVVLIYTYSCFFLEVDSLRVKYLAYVLPIFNFLAIGSAILKSINKAELALLFEIGSITFLTSILIFIGNLFGFYVNVNDILVCILISCLSMACFLMLLLYFLLSPTKFLKIRSFRYNINLIKILPDFFIPSFLHYFIQWGLIIGLSFYVSESSVGIFSTAQRFSYLINFILIVVNMITTPKFSVLYKNNKIKEIEKICVTTANYMCLALTVIVPLTILIIPLFISELDEGIGYKLFLILMIGQVVNVVTGSVGVLLNMTGNQKDMRNIMLISVCLTTIIFIVLTPFFGLYGTAISVTVGLILQNTLASWKANSILNIKTLPKILHKAIYRA